jgi:hypothetical protein
MKALQKITIFQNLGAAALSTHMDPPLLHVRLNPLIGDLAIPAAADRLNWMIADDFNQR